MSIAPQRGKRRPLEITARQASSTLSLALSPPSSLCFSFSASDSFVSPYEIPGFVEFPPRGWHGSPGWVAGLVGNDDGVSSLARPEAADEVWEIAATLQSTKRRHRRPPALYRPLSAPPAIPEFPLARPPLRFFSLPLFTSRAPPASPRPSSSFLVVGGDNSSSASAHTSG